MPLRRAVPHHHIRDNTREQEGADVACPQRAVIWHTVWAPATSGVAYVVLKVERAVCQTQMPIIDLAILPNAYDAVRL
jgi:hypothetical protein